MNERLLIAGAGGQGIVLIGKLLATAAVKDIPHVTFFPAYGAEVRGGVSNCQVILSSREIASPLSEAFDSMLIMNQASADLYRSKMGPHCLTLMNRSLCRGTESPPTVLIRATEIAEKLGDARVANFVMLGAYLARKPFVAAADIEQEFKRLLVGKSAALIELNLRAFRTGMKQGTS